MFMTGKWKAKKETQGPGKSGEVGVAGACAMVLEKLLPQQMPKNHNMYLTWLLMDNIMQRLCA